MLIMVFIYKEQAGPALPRDLPLPPLPRREKLREKGNWGGAAEEIRRGVEGGYEMRSGPSVPGGLSGRDLGDPHLLTCSVLNHLSIQ